MTLKYPLIVLFGELLFNRVFTVPECMAEELQRVMGLTAKWQKLSTFH